MIIKKNELYLYKLKTILILSEMIIFYINSYILETFNLSNLNIFIQRKEIFEKKIQDEFLLKMHVNLNEIEANFEFGRIWNKTSNHLNEINVGSSLDPSYIYKAIVTTSSVIVSQNNSTKLRLHFSVVGNFTSQDMLKI